MLAYSLNLQEDALLLEQARGSRCIATLAAHQPARMIPEKI